MPKKISIRRATEKLPEAMEGVFGNLVEHSPNIVFLIQKGRAVYINRKCEELMGYRRAEIYSADFDFFTLIIPEHREAARANIGNQLLGGESEPMECTLLTKNGQYIESIINLTPIDYHGEPAMGGIVTDINARKSSEKALANAKKELEKRVEERTSELVKINEELKLKAEILDKATDAILLRGLDDILIYANDAASQMYGYSKYEFIGMSIRSLIAPRESPFHEERHKIIRNKREITVESCHLRKDRSEILVEAHSHIINIGDQVYILSITREIAERKKAEELLRENEMRFRNIFESSPIGIELYDSEGRLIVANQSCLDIFGVSDLSAVKGFKLFEDPNVTDDVKDMLRKSEKVRYEGLFDFEKVKALKLYETTKSGTIYLDVIITPLISKGEEITSGYLVQVQDITEDKQSEDKIKRSDMQFQKLFDAMNEGVVLVDCKGKILKANMAEARMMDLSSPEEMEGRNIIKPVFQRLSPDGNPLPPEGTIVSLAIKNKRHIRNMVVGHVRDGGSIRWYSVNAAPLIDPAGNLTGIVRTATDITEQKRLQDEKEQFTHRLIAVQEEERKRIARELHDDTAQNLALLMLEIDTILNAGEKLPDRVLNNLKKLKEDTERTQREVRRYSHELRPEVLEHLGLEAALESLANDANNRGGTRISFNIDGKGRRLNEEMEMALFRIAQEATNNIWKHAEATQAEVNLKYTQEKVRLTIADNGNGFRPSGMGVSGTTGGLGLVGMMERAQLVGASLKIKSSPGKGTVISVEVVNKG